MTRCSHCGRESNGFPCHCPKPITPKNYGFNNQASRCICRDCGQAFTGSHYCLKKNNNQINKK